MRSTKPIRPSLRPFAAAAVAAFAALLLTSAAVARDAETPPASTPGFDVSALDRSADPCVNFYQFACGAWMAKNPVPADRARWGRFDELQERNLAALRGILEKAAEDRPGKDAIDLMIGDHYAACTDEKAVEARGISPLKPEMDRIAALKTRSEIAAEIAPLHLAGVNVLFRARSQQDFKDATSVIATLDQGGLGLPDRDYYTKDDAKSVEIRGQYVAHVQKMFELLGENPESAAAAARTVMDVETALAKASLERVKRRDPANIYHKMTWEELKALAPGFGWDEYRTALQAPAVASLNVAVPDFFKGLESLLASSDLPNLKTYLRWHLLHDSAGLLPAAFVDEDFAYFGRTLTGAKELRPRWKRCVERADRDLGEALGRRYVEATFGTQGKERTSGMVQALERALETDITTLPWMTEATRKQALGKLRAIANKIGYPEQWRDYGALRIARGEAIENSQRATAFEVRRQMGKIGNPVDRKEWNMSPPTVNAYYNPLLNDINFPAGILQPPFFDNAMDDAVNFGAIGAVIGHELTHGFDDQGRKFAANGNLADWWTPEDGKEFESRATCVADQYAGYVAVADVKLNGRLTLGENVADNGGVRIALMALVDTLAGKDAPLIDGFTPGQRFFLAWGQIWCQNRTDEIARMLAQTDSHSPGQYRVNGVVSNMPEFGGAFQCKPDAPIVRPSPCRVW